MVVFRKPLPLKVCFIVIAGAVPILYNFLPPETVNETVISIPKVRNSDREKNTLSDRSFDPSYGYSRVYLRRSRPESQASRAILVCVILGASPVSAAEFEGITFKDKITVQGQELVLNGLGPRFATMAKIRVYVAGLYVPAKTSNPDELIRSKGIKQMVMKFQRDVSAEQSREAWEKGLEKASRDYPGIKDRIPQLMSAMSDMKKGDEMIYSFADGKVDIIVRGESKAVIEGQDFIEALFTVWLKYPPNKEFAKGLLGSS